MGICRGRGDIQCIHKLGLCGADGQVGLGVWVGLDTLVSYKSLGRGCCLARVDDRVLMVVWQHSLGSRIWDIREAIHSRESSR